LSLASELGLKTEEELKEFVLNTISWERFAQAYFMNPDDEDEHLQLELGQIKAINALQFGYDIDSTPDNYIFSNPPKIVVMIWPRQTGKTTGVAVACATILCLQPNVKIGVMGMSEESAKNLIDRTRRFLENSPFKKILKKSLKMELQMEHGGYMKAFATSHGIRGQSFHYVMLDEAAQIDDEIIEGAALDTARKIGRRVVMLSTPAGYRGTLVKYYVQGLNTRPVICKNCYTEYTQASFLHGEFNALTMPHLDPCVECNSDKGYFYGLGDYTVISIDPFTTSFYPKKEILKELKRRGNTPLARQELLGEIIPEGQNVFRKDWIDACMNDRLQNVMKFDPRVTYMAGIDFGKLHDNSVIAIGHEDKTTRKVVLDYMRIIEADIKGKEYEDIRSEIMEVIMFYKPVWLIPDATGMGEPIIEIMEKDLKDQGWRGRVYSNKNNRLGFIFDIKSKPDLIENLVEYFARTKLEMPPVYEAEIGVLVNELLNFSYDQTQSNYVKYGVQLEHDDTVIALALMVWGHKHKPWIPVRYEFGLPRGGLNTGY
jgi:hypothetical protein